MKVKHTLEPFYTNDSEILILGTMPSVKSREIGFYYMHPQNRFWKILATIFEEEIGNNIEDKKEFLIKHKIALWDVCKSCNISGSADLSIKNVIPNDIGSLIKKTKIKRIYTTGRKAWELYNKFILAKTKIPAISLYSSSPLNCAIPFEKIVENYQVINSKKI